MLYTVSKLIKWEKGIKKYVWVGNIIFRFESLYKNRHITSINKLSKFFFKQL